MNIMVHEFGFIRYMHISVSVSILSEVRSIKSLDLLTIIQVCLLICLFQGYVVNVTENLTHKSFLSEKYNGTRDLKLYQTLGPFKRGATYTVVIQRDVRGFIDTRPSDPMTIHVGRSKFCWQMAFILCIIWRHLLYIIWSKFGLHIIHQNSFLSSNFWQANKGIHKIRKCVLYSPE